MTRPGIADAVRSVTTYGKNLQHTHWKAVVKILEYLRKDTGRGDNVLPEGLLAYFDLCRLRLCDRLEHVTVGIRRGHDAGFYISLWVFEDVVSDGVVYHGIGIHCNERVRECVCFFVSYRSLSNQRLRYTA